MEFTFTENNQCVICKKDFVGSKKASKVIHIGMEHKKILDILHEELGKNGYLKNENEEFFEDEVTPENLGIVCKICAVAETSNHELLTYY